MYKFQRTNLLREIAIIGVYAAIGFGLAFVLSAFVLFGATVSTSSMYGTIPPQSRVFGIRTWLPLAQSEPARGDIVVISSPTPHLFTEPVIKRVVGLPSEEIVIRGGIVYINGTPLYESYLAEPARGDLATIHIPDGHFFLMGDNRNNSRDSRHWGAICGTTIIGRILIHR